MGASPSHPELLDWLAASFCDSGGSLKRLHRLIVTSAVYRQSVRHDPSFAAIDADNRGSGGRTAAGSTPRSIHDAILEVAGRLDPHDGRPVGPAIPLSPASTSRRWSITRQYDWDSPGSRRRSVYRFLFRTLPDPFFDTLDAADASQLTAVRNESTTPLQALVLLNNPFVLRQCEHFARRLETLAIRAVSTSRCGWPSSSPTAAWRHPTKSRLLSDYAARHGLANLCRLIFNSNEFLFVN